MIKHWLIIGLNLTIITFSNHDERTSLLGSPLPQPINQLDQPAIIRIPPQLPARTHTCPCSTGYCLCSVSAACVIGGYLLYIMIEETIRSSNATSS